MKRKKKLMESLINKKNEKNCLLYVNEKKKLKKNQIKSCNKQFKGSEIKKKVLDTY